MAVCRHACHQLLPWLWATFAIVPDAAWAGSDQWPRSTAPATGPVCRLGRPSASDSGGVERCVLSLCCPQCMCVCSVLAHLAPVHRCGRCVRFACAVGGCIPPPSPLIFFSFLFSFFALYLFCFVLLFFLKMEKGALALGHRHGQLVQRCCSVMFSGVRRRCFVGGRAPGVRLARLDVHGYAPGWLWLVASLLLVLAGLGAVYAVGVGCGYGGPWAGWVRGQGLEVTGCGSGSTCDEASAGAGRLLRVRQFGRLRAWVRRCWA